MQQTNSGIIELAFEMAGRVSQFSEQARAFYYAVMLSGHNCTACGGSLVMIQEGICRCDRCLRQFDPTLTLQRCSQCGWTRRANRRGESFRCTSCGFATHADRNAALNLSLDLEPLSGRERREKMNVGGFHWYESSRGQERMVPDV